MLHKSLTINETTQLLPKKEPIATTDEFKNSAEELKQINDELNQLIYEEGRSKSTIKCAIPGITANVVTFFAFNHFAPGLGPVKGLISSAAGAITHTATQKIAGNDTGPALKTGSRTGFSVLLSEGVRSVGRLVDCPIANPIISPVIQGLFHCTNLKDTTEADKARKIKALVKRQNELTASESLPKDHVINMRST